MLPERGTKLTLASDKAFPVFVVPPAATFSTHADPVLSHPNHYKFFLLRTLCEGLVKESVASGATRRGSIGGYNSDSGSGGVIGGRKARSRSAVSAGSLGAYSAGGGEDAGDADGTALTKAALRCLEQLLDFGFLSTKAKLTSIATVCTDILGGGGGGGGGGGALSPAAAEMRRSALGLLMGVADLRASYRLYKLLSCFKERSLTAPKSDGCRHYLRGSSPKGQAQLFEDFEKLFTTDDAADLDVAKLTGCATVDELYVAAIMDPDDNLMAAGLKILMRSYGQRQKLSDVLGGVLLLPTPALPVFGDVHTLRVELNDLGYWLNTYSDWGVHSKLSGPFRDAEFNQVMATLDRLLRFLHTAPEAARSTLSRVVGASLDLDDLDGDVASGVAHGGGGNDGWDGARPMDGTFRCEGFVSTGLWTCDVAAAWSQDRKPTAATAAGAAAGQKPQTGEVKRPRRLVGQHQDILRALNVAELLVSTALGSGRLDSAIAYQGSVCSESEKAESQRRLRLVHGALLRLSVCFADRNRENQSLLVPCLGPLETLAKSVSVGAQLQDLAREVILASLRGSEALSESIPTSLFMHFALVADAHVPCPSESPALEFFFIACRPEGRPLSKHQSVAVDVLLSEATPNLTRLCRFCVEAAVEATPGG